MHMRWWLLTQKEWIQFIQSEAQRLTNDGVLDWAVLISHFADYGSCSRTIAKGSINCQLVVQLLAVFEFEIHAKGVRNWFNLGLVSIALDVSRNTKTTCGDGLGRVMRVKVSIPSTRLWKKMGSVWARSQLTGLNLNRWGTNRSGISGHLSLDPSHQVGVLWIHGRWRQKYDCCKDLH